MKTDDSVFWAECHGRKAKQWAARAMTGHDPMFLVSQDFQAWDSDTNGWVQKHGLQELKKARDMVQVNAQLTSRGQC